VPPGSTPKDPAQHVGFTTTQAGNACTTVPVVYKLRDKALYPEVAAEGPMMDVCFHKLADIQKKVQWLVADTAADPSDCQSPGGPPS
jgi:hypothetical protein